MAISKFQSEADKFGKAQLLQPTYTRIESRGRVIEVAVIDGFQNTPASRYHEGVDVAIMRYHSDELRIPNGIYKLRVKAHQKISEPGNYTANSELYDAEGRLVFSCPHRFDVTSVELPEHKGNRDVAVRVNSFPENLEQHTFEDHLEFTINYCCENGTCGTCIGPACPT